MRIGLKSVCCLAVLVAPLASQGVVNNWTGGGGDSNWVTSANWSQGWAPAAGEVAVIDNAKVNLFTDTADLGGLLITNGAILSVYSPATNGATQWGLLVSVSGTVTIAANSWIYPYSENTNGGSPFFRCQDLVLAPNGGFDANKKGFAGGIYALGGYNPKGYGPGGSLGSVYSSGGGGYGGQGGTGYDGPQSAPGGSAYGDYMNPIDPGSGCGGAQVADGRRGGGLVRIEAAGSVLVDGSILANGEDGGGYPGASSGGGINIKCNTFRGTGLLKAVGGNDIRNVLSRFGGSGGGGRIAVVYATTAQTSVSPQPTVRFNASGGIRTVAGPSLAIARMTQGGPGSIYLSDAQFFDLANVQGGEIKVPGVTSWTTNNLSVADGLIAFPSGFILTVTQNATFSGAGGIDLSNSVVTIGGDLVINSDRRSSVFFRGGPNQQINIGTNLNLTKGWIEINHQESTNLALSIPGSITLDEANLYFTGNSTNASALNVLGNTTATNGSLVFLYSGATNNLPSYGLLVDVAGDMKIAPNCWIYPYSQNTNGGSVYFRTANLTVNTNAGFDATGKGFGGGIYNVNSSRGYGPGTPPGLGGGGDNPGAGYGGTGGDTQYKTGGPTYGDSNAPALPGSGGPAGGWGDYAPGGYGGGLIYIDASATVIVDGSLLADGLPGANNQYAGPGSGGGICVSCKLFNGASSGFLSAKGAANIYGQTTGNGGGGGGRIAVRYKTTNNWLGNAIVDGGAGKWTNGAPGTIVWTHVSGASGTVILVE
jgi:hypothetical protein